MTLKSLILLFLADNLNYYKSNYWSYEAIYQFLGGLPAGRQAYSGSSVRVAVSQLLESGDLEKIVKNNTVCFSLTAKGFRSLSERFLKPHQGLKNRWDGKWRIIIFDIPENKREERARIRQILRKSRFGRLANSVYISPFNNLEATVQKDLNLFTFETRRGEDLAKDRTIAQIAFRLDELEKKYNDWIEKAKKLQGGLDILIPYYDTVLGLDPALFEELLPPNWPFLKSWSIFIGLLKKKRILATEKTGN